MPRRKQEKGSGVFVPEIITRRMTGIVSQESVIIQKEDMIIGALPAIDLIKEGSL